MDKSRIKTVTAALRDFFGYKAGTGLKEFQEEVKALSDKEREEFKGMLEGEGYSFEG